VNVRLDRTGYSIVVAPPNCHRNLCALPLAVNVPRLALRLQCEGKRLNAMKRRSPIDEYTQKRGGYFTWIFSRVLIMHLLLPVQISAAVPQPVTITGGYSGYEQEAITATERALETPTDFAPEGKVIEEVILISLDPIEPRDPLPLEINVLHRSTQQYVIERELLLQKGDRYRKVLADESARKLRALAQLSLVLCIAVKGHSDRAVRLVVITKDVWSLYVDFDIGAFNTHSGYLLLEPKETNLLGTHQSALARFRLDPATVVVGAGYRVPRAFGRALWFVTDANVVLNREISLPEGSYGTMEVVQPLVTTWQRWAWFGAANFRRDIARSFDSNGKLSLDDNGVPNEWHRREGTTQFATTRSFGWATKQDITVSASMAQRRYSTVDIALPVSANQPRDDVRASVGVEWHSYSSSFLRTFNLDTLGLQEDYRLGHDIILAVYPSLGTLGGTSREFLSVTLALQETMRLETGFVRVFATWQADTKVTSSSDAVASAGSYIASPQLGFGRLIQSNWFSDRYLNQRNLKYGIGGTGRLRGFDTIWGNRIIASNLEYRTPALSLLELQWGAVAFYDMGTAFDDWKRFEPQHSLGIGLRLVIPQLERKGFRLDFAFPVRSEATHPPANELTVYFTFGQAFDSMPIRGVAPPIAL